MDRQPGRGHAETALWAADPERAWQLATDALNFVPEDQYAHYTTRLHAIALRAAADRAQRAVALNDEQRAGEARDDARAIFEHLRALLAPGRWHHGGPGPEPAAFDALSIAELSRADGRSDPRHGTRRRSASRRWESRSSWATRAGVRPRR